MVGFTTDQNKQGLVTDDSNGVSINVHITLFHYPLLCVFYVACYAMCHFSVESLERFTIQTSFSFMLPLEDPPDNH